MKDVRLIQEVYLLLNELISLDHHQNVTLQELDIDSVIDGCLGAIHVLLRDDVQRTILIEADPHSVVSTLTEFITRPSINFQREAVGSLCELVQVKFHIKTAVLASCILSAYFCEIILYNLKNLD
mgnify:CR=1 FL=1